MRQVVLVIGSAVDLVGVDDVLHGRRVGIIARECAKRLGWDQATQTMLFDAGILHDCGVSSTRVRHNLVNELDWQGSNIHCERGYELLKGFAPLSHIAPIILYHHTHWEELTGLDLAPTTARYANLIYLADRIDVNAAPYYRDNSFLLYVDHIRNLINRYRGTFFAPELVDAFLDASRAEAFWLLLDEDFISQYVTEMGRLVQKRRVDIGELKKFAHIVADIVDAKSSFTGDHSLGVARLARLLARKAGITGERLDLIEVAALLHDIGKLQIPDEVLESTAKLTAPERALMKKHSFATYQILRPIGGFEEVARWASEHHESLNGDGYPFRLLGGDIPLESRIIKVADVYQALAQDRPYRKPKTAAEILQFLRAMQEENEVDPMMVDFVARHPDECYRAAIGQAARPLSQKAP
jgi:putative nucleotidyltransferase with HDIG domain